MSATEQTALQPLPFRVLIDRAMVLTRRYFKTVFVLPAVFFSAVGVLALIVQMHFFASMQAAAERASAADALGGFAAFGLFTLVYAGLVVVTVATMTAVAVDAVAGRSVRVGRRLGDALKPRFLGTLVLSVVLIGVSFLFCFFPAIYVGLLFFLVVPVMAEERRFGFAALGRSRALIRYNPQSHFVNAPIVKAFVIVLVTWLLSITVSAVVQVPFGVAKQVLLFRAIAAEGGRNGAMVSPVIPWLDFPAAVLGGLTTAAVQIYGAFATAVFFFDVRSRKEGLDLEGALARIETSIVPAAPQTAARAPLTGPADAGPTGSDGGSDPGAPREPN